MEIEESCRAEVVDKGGGLVGFQAYIFLVSLTEVHAQKCCWLLAMSIGFEPRLPSRDDFEPYETPDHFKMLLAVRYLQFLHSSPQDPGSGCEPGRSTYLRPRKNGGSTTSMLESSCCMGPANSCMLLLGSIYLSRLPV